MAFGDVKFTSNNNTAMSDTRVGWTVGGGMKHAVTDHWLVRAEVRYIDLGKKSTLFAPAGVRVKASFESANATLGVSYKF